MRMARDGDVAGAGTTAAMDALIERLNRELLDNVALDELERRAKAVTVIIKAQQALAELGQGGARPKDEDGRMDAADEQALRDRILSRLDGLVAELEQKGADRCPACGRVEPDRDGLAGVGAGLAETA